MECGQLCVLNSTGASPLQPSVTKIAMERLGFTQTTIGYRNFKQQLNCNKVEIELMAVALELYSRLYSQKDYKSG